MIKADIVIDFPKWKTKIRNPNLYFKKKIEKLSLINLFSKKSFYFTLLLTNKKVIKKLNKKFRKKNKSTDVLSFPFYKKSQLKKKLQNDKEIYLGDIIINLNKIKRKKKGIDFKLQFNKLWIHGLVHLFGYEHNKNKDYYKMLKIEKDFLSYLNK